VLRVETHRTHRDKLCEPARGCDHHVRAPLQVRALGRDLCSGR